MKRMFSIVFVILYLISTSAYLDVLKLPLLVEHFLDHKKSNAAISFSDFLELHYSGEAFNHSHSNKKNPHDGLPFHHQTTTTNLVVAQPILLYLYMKLPFQFTDKKRVIINTNSFTDTRYVSSIWQPPRFC